MGIALLSLLAAGAISVGDGPRPDTVTIQGHGDKVYMASAEGLTLYVYDVELKGRLCVDQCERTWPPLAAKRGAKAVGDWAPLARPDGTLQWSYQGRRVYNFVGDARAGEAEGDQPRGDWHVITYGGPRPQAALPAEAKVSRLGQRFIFTSYRDQPLYTFARDGEVPACKGECLEVWPPLRAPATAAAIGDWTPVERSDGIRQWAYKGQLVYTYSEDVTPWEAHGDNAGGVWKLITVEPATGSTVADASPSEGRR